MQASIKNNKIALGKLMENNDKTSKNTREAGYKFARDNFDANKNPEDTFSMHQDLTE
jgi:hypothetical protein